jgi:hypothetical protein
VGLSFDDVAAAALALPEVDAHDHFDQPAYRLRGKILVTLRHGDCGTPLAVLEPPAEEIAAVTAADPAADLPGAQPLVGDGGGPPL